MEKENHHVHKSVDLGSSRKPTNDSQGFLDIRRAKKFGLIGLLTFTIAGTGLALASGINYLINKADNNVSTYSEYNLKIEYSK